MPPCLLGCTETSEKSLSLGLDYRLSDHNPQQQEAIHHFVLFTTTILKNKDHQAASPQQQALKELVEKMKQQTEK
jgi:hypothetical protein